jgi:hypothetical protein
LKSTNKINNKIITFSFSKRLNSTKSFTKIIDDYFVTSAHKINKKSVPFVSINFSTDDYTTLFYSFTHQ